MRKTFILFLILFCFQVANAKPPENPETFNCAVKAGDDVANKPVFLYQSKSGPVISICGFKDDQTSNYSHLTLQVFADPKGKPKKIFSNNDTNKKFLTIEKHDGLMLIEKVKIKDEYVELFKHDISCNKDSCEVKKEICLAYNKVKQKWILRSTKDSKIKARMKKSGC